MDVEQHGDDYTPDVAILINEVNEIHNRDTQRQSEYNQRIEERCVLSVDVNSVLSEMGVRGKCRIP
jgi:hypothetical protein